MHELLQFFKYLKSKVAKQRMTPQTSMEADERICQS